MPCSIPIECHHARIVSDFFFSEWQEGRGHDGDIRRTFLSPDVVRGISRRAGGGIQPKQCCDHSASAPGLGCWGPFFFFFFPSPFVPFSWETGGLRS